RELLDLVWPSDSPGCGAPATPAGCCPGCRAALAAPGPGSIPLGGVPLWAAAGYDGVARRLLLAYKERGAVALADPLGNALAGAVTTGATLRQAVRALTAAAAPPVAAAVVAATARYR